MLSFYGPVNPIVIGLTQATFVLLESYCFSCFGGVAIQKIPVLKFNVVMAIKMVTGHKTNNLDNHQMLINAKYGSHPFTGYGENAI